MTENDKFQQHVANVYRQHLGERVVLFEYQGKRYWLKQVEQLAGAMRLLKQNSVAALNKEIGVLNVLSHLGAPVPAVVDFGVGYMVVEDVGDTINHVLDHTNETSWQPILNDASIALAKLHSMQFAHGRPALRDISWQAGEVRFIDFEANQQHKSLISQQIRDLLVFIHSLYRYIGPNNSVISQAINCYRLAGGEAIWQQAKQFLASWQWLYYFARLFRDIGGKDLKPVYWVLWHFRQAPVTLT
ncbi:serine/threonine protein phosphatase [Shewanella livingstonensis]|uniref:Serine/threonine protein phosphatase n=1 Tax=Shewanella livingstonensis TaxID=150120 RepID=A0A3G8LVN1_9GAMM|nr:serine/threonine protein phosphatase [Shewanella livingstonensis]AZG73681.1 serine/threonine protein phosphatase [Shewanella livingstonensis]